MAKIQQKSYCEKIWIGKEIEGKLKGLDSMFIQGEIDFNIIQPLIKKHKPSQIYLGAGKTEITLDYFMRIKNKIQNENSVLVITLETRDIQTANIVCNYCRVIYRQLDYNFEVFNKKWHNVTIKLEDLNSVYCYETTIKSSKKKLKKDLTYTSDKVIYEK